MNTLQQIIEEMEADFLRANKIATGEEHFEQSPVIYNEGYADALKKHIPQLTLLLNAETQATVKSKPA